MSQATDIERVLAEFVRRFDDRDPAGWSALFAEDATYTSTTEGTFTGRPAIRQYIDNHIARTPNRRVRHLCGNPVIVIDGERASANIDFLTYEDTGQGWRLFSCGRYDTHLVRQNAEWLYVDHVHSQFWRNGQPQS
jgi:3-phenylpropionate/cinnamic acid dioxygenase small subunit